MTTTESFNSTVALAAAADPYTEGVGHFITKIILLVVALVTNLLGNATIVISVHRFEWLHEKMFVAIQMLAIADISVFYTIIQQILGRMYPIPYSAVGVVLGFIQSTTAYSAFYHIILVAIERFIAVIHPFWYGSTFTEKHIRLMSLGLWMIAAISAFGDILITFARTL